MKSAGCFQDIRASGAASVKSLRELSKQPVGGQEVAVVQAWGHGHVQPSAGYRTGDPWNSLVSHFRKGLKKRWGCECMQRTSNADHTPHDACVRLLHSLAQGWAGVGKVEPGDRDLDPDRIKHL